MGELSKLSLCQGIDKHYLHYWFILISDINLQVGALITVGCVLSVDPKVDEVLEAIKKDSVSLRHSQSESQKDNVSNEECDDFEEGYSDDEMFIVMESKNVKESNGQIIFKSWILDICFKNMGWTFKYNNIVVNIYLIFESISSQQTRLKTIN